MKIDADTHIAEMKIVEVEVEVVESFSHLVANIE
jgi:hypothetical protein